MTDGRQICRLAAAAGQWRLPGRFGATPRPLARSRPPDDHARQPPRQKYSACRLLASIRLMLAEMPTVIYYASRAAAARAEI